MLCWGQIVVLSHLRFAASIGVLAASLLISSAAVAVADADSRDSAGPGHGGANASRQGSTTPSRPVGDVTDTQRSKTQRVTSTLGSGRQSGQQPSPGGEKPKDEPGGTHTKDGTKDDSDLGAAVPDPVAAVPNEVAPVSDPVAGIPNEVAPVSDPVAPAPDVVGPVSNVSVLVQDMLSSVAGTVVLLAQLPSDLSSLLVDIAGVQPVVGGVAGSHGPGPSAAAAASVTSRLPLGLPLAAISGSPLAGVSGLPVTGEATGVASLDVIALGRASAVSGMAPLAPDTAFPIGAGQTFRHIFGELLLPVSLWALAAGALPGAGGLGFLTLAGVRVGYRQAKAGFALRTTGIAHLARPGAVSLGVVRSGSLVVVRPRALRVVRPGAFSAEHVLDKVA